MIRSRLGLKALGLCAMLVGMFAFASAAQAETGAFWLVNGAKISESLLPTVEAETDVKGVLLTTLGGQAIDISCVKTLVVGGHLVEPNGKILGKLVFHECDFLSLKEGVATLQKACEPFVGANKGLIETHTLTGLIKLHEGQPTILATPPTVEGSTLFATINLGEECAFGSALKVGNGKDKSGKVLESEFSLKDCEGKGLTDLKKHLVEELKALTALYVNGGETKATIDGSAWAFLGGAHAGMTFAAHAA
jgi:hypothetical protein